MSIDAISPTQEIRDGRLNIKYGCVITSLQRIGKRHAFVNKRSITLVIGWNPERLCRFVRWRVPGLHNCSNSEVKIKQIGRSG